MTCSLLEDRCGESSFFAKLSWELFVFIKPSTSDESKIVRMKNSLAERFTKLYEAMKFNENGVFIKIVTLNQNCVFRELSYSKKKLSNA